MPPSGFKCKQCGNCCLNLRDAFETCATEEDMRLWEEKGREDILEWVDPIPTVSYTHLTLPTTPYV